MEHRNALPDPVKDHVWAGAILEGFLNKPINLLVLVFHEALASRDG